jgi:adenosylcobyric acid synthase
VGTLALISDSEQARTAGFIINRFRGDIALLEPGLDWLAEHTGKPVFGVLPYLHGLVIDSEDSVSAAGTSEAGALKVVVPVLPRISNHNDFDPLRLHPGVDLVFVGPDETIPPADLIILPGSKSTRHDLQWLKQQGWPEAIQKHLRYGGKLLGICGGFQMLGLRVEDPDGLEGEVGNTEGLALFEMVTRMVSGKQLRQVTGRLSPEVTESGVTATMTGYEMHNGVTEGSALARPFAELDGRPDGAVSADGQMAGTYVHGLFDEPAACDAILCWAGLNTQNARSVDYQSHRLQQLDRLADQVEQCLDTDRLRSLLQL